MQQTNRWLSVRLLAFFAIVLTAMLVPFQGNAQAPAAGNQPNQNLPGTRRWNIFENERVIVDGRTYAPGQRPDPPGQSHPENPPRDVLTIMLTAGDVEINNTGEKVETGHFEAGTTWWWPKPPGKHSIANVGNGQFTFINIRLK